jgi:hypothetical protein
MKYLARLIDIKTAIAKMDLFYVTTLGVTTGRIII